MLDEISIAIVSRWLNASHYFKHFTYGSLKISTKIFRLTKALAMVSAERPSPIIQTLINNFNFNNKN